MDWILRAILHFNYLMLILKIAWCVLIVIKINILGIHGPVCLYLNPRPLLGRINFKRLYEELFVF